jgi:hypothetical protein
MVLKKKVKKLSTRKSPAKSTRKSPAKTLRKAQRKKKTAKVTKKLPKKSSKKRIIKKSTTRKNPTKSTHKNLAKGNLIGLITHYFPHVQAAVIKLKAPLSIGETIKIKGHTTDLTQAITSMQMDRVNISNAKKGMEIGVQVSARVRQGDKVYKS